VDEHLARSVGLLNWPVVFVPLVVAYTVVCKNIGARRLCAVLLWPGTGVTKKRDSQPYTFGETFRFLFDYCSISRSISRSISHPIAHPIAYPIALKSSHLALSLNYIPKPL